jgi:hypothetical protein
MGYQGCNSCRNRIGKDHQDEERCPVCPAKVKKRKKSGSKKNQGKIQKKLPEQTSNRSQRSEHRPNYTEPPNERMDEDSEEASDNDSDDMQIGYLCISTDPRRVGVGDGDPMILKPKELRQTLTLQQTMADQTMANPTVRGIQQLRKNSIQTIRDSADVLRHIIQNVSSRLVGTIQSPAAVTKWENFFFRDFEEKRDGRERRNPQGHGRHYACTNGRG